MKDEKVNRTHLMLTPGAGTMPGHFDNSKTEAPAYQFGEYPDRVFNPASGAIKAFRFGAAETTG